MCDHDCPAHRRPCPPPPPPRPLADTRLITDTTPDGPLPPLSLSPQVRQSKRTIYLNSICILVTAVEFGVDITPKKGETEEEEKRKVAKRGRERNESSAGEIEAAAAVEESAALSIIGP